ncbi:sugar ABC transporter ATP-binding protein [Microlunatus speluncae]|uniref:sugar ABC transporter ATP-binding protein n=1 Tax=Microlunatus speluncae TaxID=2594267 RepID=UPI0012660F72|nr:sugar ABC transporter ATP-binding protein [Microlunatus speluncae]
MSRLLEVGSISKSFPGVQALADVSFELAAGEVLALVGENGAGKSTLMKILSGIHPADAGTIMLDGRPVMINSPRAAQQLGISIIHQEMNLMPQLTVAQNIYIGREPRIGGLFTSERGLINRTVQLLHQTGIVLDPRATVDSLTVAQQQMVEIAKAMSFPATRVLIMDEPTSALSAAETDVLFGLIRTLAERGVGIIYISHRMEELRRIADRVTILRDGHHVADHRMDEVEDAMIISEMVGRTLSAAGRPDPAPRSEEIALEVIGLTTPRLLRDVSFTLRRGEILGFAGLVGAGRTETARAIIGADRHSRGQILVGGRPVRIAHPADAVRHGIGYLSEDRKRFGLLLERTVNSNILLASLRDYTSRIGFVQAGRGRRTSRRYVDLLRIKTPSIDTATMNLSGGNQQKIVIAKWLARDCDVLIFDEPTRGIDVGAKEEIYALLSELAEQGKSIIVISSELPEVLRVSHRIAVMAAGRITGILDNADADSESIMALATRFHGPTTIEAIAAEPAPAQKEDLR